MKTSRLFIKKPKSCPQDDLKNFKQLVLEGGQVNPNGLETKIRQCKYLEFYYIDGILIAISAKKEKDKNVVKRTQAKAKIELVEIPTIELGYSYTTKAFRKRGINKEINDKLLALVQSQYI